MDGDALAHFVCDRLRPPEHKRRRANANFGWTPRPIGAGQLVPRPIGALPIGALANWCSRQSVLWPIGALADPCAG
jgi:hypothetical protein